MNHRFASARASWWAAAGAACLAITAGMVPRTAAAQTQFTWSSSAATGSWGTAGNWAGGVAPTGGAVGSVTGSNALTFGATSGPTSLVNNIGGVPINSLTFLAGAPAYTITGSTFIISGTGQIWNSAGFYNFSTNKQTLSLSISDPATLSVSRANDPWRRRF